MNCRYKAYYFEEFPISRLTLCMSPHLIKDGIKTGGMEKNEFLALKDSIDMNGQINPIIVEVDSGGPPRYRICMGNNRVESLLLLGKEHVRARVIHRSRVPEPADGEFERITDDNLIPFMKKAHPGDELWKKSAWAQRILKFVAEKADDWSILQINTLPKQLAE
jgi:hypothetical protein